MREYSISLREHIVNGLRRSKRNKRHEKGQGSRRNTPGCVRAYNVKCYEDGVGPYEPVVIPFSQDILSAYGITYEWPFPQLLKGKKWMFLAHKQSIFIVNTADWSLYSLETLTSYPKAASNFTIQQGTQWQLIDFWNTWLLTNGYSNVFNAGFDTMLGNADSIYINNGTRINAGCAHRGRSWLGGFNPDYFHSDNLATGEWETFWEGWADDLEADIDETKYTGLGQNWVMWSTIGGGDMFQIFNLITSRDGYISSDYGAVRPLIFDLLKQNTCGRMPMPWQGAVRVMKPLGDYVIIYGDDGVSVLAPSGPNVGLIDLNVPQGIFNTGAVGGNDNEHVFLDGTGALWHLNRDLSLEKLDYREWLAGLIGEEVIISYSAGNREFYICSSNRGFLLSMEGGRARLTEHGQRVTSVVDYQGYVMGMGTTEDYMDSNAALKSAEIVTDSIDFGFREHKTLTGVQVHGDVTNIASSYTGHPSLQVAADYRYDVNGLFQTSTLKPLNKLGYGASRVTAPDLRVRLKSDEFRDIDIDDLVCHYQVADKRFTRGPNVADLK